MGLKMDSVFWLFAVVGCTWSAGEGVGLALDQALLTLYNHLPEDGQLFYVSACCYKCQSQLLLTVGPGSSDSPSNASICLSTCCILNLELFVAGGNSCSWSELYGDHGWYSVSVQPWPSGQNESGLFCTFRKDCDPQNGYISLLVALAIFVAVILLYFLGLHVSKLRCTQDCYHLFQRKCFPGMFNHASEPHLPDHVPPEETKKKRLLSLDTFRGLSLTLMVFVNYGGGGYWFFEHAPWNGLTVADLVMPWFVFILGASVGLAFHIMWRRRVRNAQLFRKVAWRTGVLIAIGVLFLNYGPADGPWSWSWARLPGVFQRLSFTYFVVALMQIAFGVTDIQKYQVGTWWAPLRDVVLYWQQWLVIIGLEILWLCLTFLLPVPGCPRGYLGPGGIGDDGKYFNCTGGAAAYIDKQILGENHLYCFPSCKELYRTTQPFDPEGILGTINSIVMAFFGLQAGRIILMYHTKPWSILKRFLIWSVLLGIISATLTLGTQNEGFIPVNKNLWNELHSGLCWTFSPG
ncbi:heparan-alpha-glucosaminide N-acetyltransferase-like [Vombatus ursinus]|uniref:heparan-alpha-glucosaminide N-acetyltransferase-like n=1 Tax=Vombatus ursinus TaxID=29139 RepID=UPI000FFD3759|nr:heparan-alpha-glucosaminide N-acetyltransferase-like [Vombatus ursinus]